MRISRAYYIHSVEQEAHTLTEKKKLQLFPIKVKDRQTFTATKIKL